MRPNLISYLITTGREAEKRMRIKYNIYCAYKRLISTGSETALKWIRNHACNLGPVPRIGIHFL